MTLENDELTDEMRAACDAIDMTPLLGTPAERLRFALDKALKFWREKRLAVSAEKLAWSEHKQQAAIAGAAIALLKKVAKADGLDGGLRVEVEEFLGPWIF